MRWSDAVWRHMLPVGVFLAECWFCVHLIAFFPLSLFLVLKKISMESFSIFPIHIRWKKCTFQFPLNDSFSHVFSKSCDHSIDYVWSQESMINFVMVVASWKICCIKRAFLLVVWKFCFIIQFSHFNSLHVFVFHSHTR